MSGDIDVLITSSDYDEKTIRKLLINNLKEKKIIIDTFSSGDTKFMGICKIPEDQYARHIDIIDTSIDSFPFAQLYFTGSGRFNTIMRQHCLKLGYTLNEHNLSYKNKTQINSDLIYNKIGKNAFETENDIFKFLDMEYVLPCDRDLYTYGK